MAQSYWNKVLNRRMTRRRTMVASGATAAGAAFLIACGGGDDTESTGNGGNGGNGGTGGTAGTGGTGGTSSLLADKSDTTSQARRGGSMVYPTSREPNHFDGQSQGQVQLNPFNGIVYEALVRNRPGIGEPSTWTEVLPELAESWEISPDQLQITFHLREGVRWQDRSPINGREFDAEDVVAAWNRYETVDTPNNKSTNSNNINPEAPIVGFTATDSHTVVLELARPASYILQRLTVMTTGEVGSIYPRETGDSFDPEQDQIGTGAWELENFEPSVELRYRRNPDYWGADDTGFLDELHFPIIPEYAQELAQLRRGAVSTIDVAPEDVVQLKQDVPDLALYQFTAATNSTGAAMRFGWLPIQGNPSPFLDIRVRRALAMSLDREGFIDAFSNVTPFEQAGLPVNTYYYTTQGYVPEWTLDPRDASTFGENAVYFERNMEEARKLFDAAQSDYPGGQFPPINSHAVQAVFGPTYIAESEAMDGFARELGFQIENVPLDYNSDYLPSFVTQEGQFEGILYGIGAVTSGDMTDYYLWRFYSQTGATSGQLGFGGPDGSAGDRSGDPHVDDLIVQATEELDTEARREIIHELQRYLAGQQYMVTRPGFADSFAIAWPAIENFATFQNDSRLTNDGMSFGLMNYWYNDEKPHGG